MSETPLPADLREFLKERIGSLDHLQALLLAQRDPRRNWSAEEAATALRVASSIATAAFARLEAQGLVERLGGEPPLYRYRGTVPDVDAVIGRLDAAFRSDPIAIITCLSADAIERMRTAAMRAFADSFVIGRKRNG